MQENNNINTDVVVIGAGLTGLTTAHLLRQAGVSVIVIERQNRIGGQIQTYHEDDFIYESGPNTGAVSWPDVAELFETLSDSCTLQTADEAAKRRLIWKGDRFHALPSSLSSALATPLFTWHDKIRILGEPFRAKGTNPDESVGQLARRRLGKSYLDYAVNPFISGVYAGDPMKLVTRYALPKLYRLEAEHGSFIKGSIAKMRQPKTPRDLKATKQVFSAQGGLTALVSALGKSIGADHILTGCDEVVVSKAANEMWTVNAVSATQGKIQVSTRRVITTVGAYALPHLLPFAEAPLMQAISSLHYAPIVQVSVGLRYAQDGDFRAFGALVPQCEHKDILGILYPSSCFTGRAPQGGVLMSFFLGGVNHADMLTKSDEEITQLVTEALSSMLHLKKGTHPNLLHIFRHERAIPQYEADSGERFAAVETLQQRHPGLIIAGNLRNGIGMADRIHQATLIAHEVAASLRP